MKKLYFISGIAAISMLSYAAILKYKQKILKKTSKSKKTIDFCEYFKESNIVPVYKAEYTYDELKENLNQLKRKYYDLIQVNILGKSNDKRNIYEVILGNKKAKKHFLIHGGIHGCEYLNCLLIMKILEEYLKNYKTAEYKGIKYSSLFEKVAFHIIPMVNPDGVMISEFGIEEIKDFKLKEKIRECYKNDIENDYTDDSFNEYLKKWKANSRGVDLNRNFNAEWESLNQNSSCSFMNFKGESCESEIETRLLVNLTENYNFSGTISYHSSGNLIYWDYEKSRVRIQSNYLADVARLITGYEKAKSDKNYYEVVSGGYKDWVSSKEINPIPSITLEVGEKECPLDISEFEAAYCSNKHLWLEYAYLFNIE